MRTFVTAGVGVALVAAIVTAVLWRVQRTGPDHPGPHAQPGTAALLDNVINRDNRLKQNGEHRAALAQTRQRLEREYPGLVDRLDLTEKEASELFDLLTAQEQTRQQAAASASGAGPGDPAAAAAATREMQHLQRQQEAEQLAVLGTTRHAQFLEYQRIRQSQAPTQ